MSGTGGICRQEDIMTRKAPPEVELKWTNGSFRAAGEPALILVAALVAVLGIAYLLVEKIFG
jgi:hypothetical protein